MSGTRYYNRVDSDNVSDQIQAQMSRNIRSFALEVGQNCRRVAGFFTSFWIICSYYVCTTQCAIQACLNSLTEYLEFCEADIVYHPTSYWRPFCKETRKNDDMKLEKPTDTCICGEELKANQYEVRKYSAAVSRWLRRAGFPAELEDSAKWNDGTYMWQVLKRIGGTQEWPTRLSPGKKKENWSLIGAQIKRYYPGLVENQIILFCLIASPQVSMHHVVYILHRTMNQHKRTWRAVILKQALRTSGAMASILQPRFAVSGSGISHANINLRNEFKVETSFPCPPFTVEVQDSSGEIWRETTNNARIILHRGEEYSSMTDMRHSERPIEIVKVSRFLYKVFYIVRAKGVCKISIRPGIKRCGHIYGSPFTVQADGAALARPSPSQRHTHFPEWKDKMGISNGTDQNIVKRTKDMDNESGQEKAEVKQQETLLKSSFFTNYLKKSMDMITKVFATSSKSPTSEPVKKKVKRKTMIDPTSNWPGRQRVLSNIRPLYPSSRRLKIRSVTIHRYINDAMPSIEQYFLGKDFNVDENGNVARDAGKDRGIMRLMRQSFSADMDNATGETTKKHRSISNQKESIRKHRLRKENHVFSAPWSRGKRHSDSKYRNGIVGKWKESSSSSESDVHEMEFVRELNREDTMRKLSASTEEKPKGVSTMRRALHGDSGITDMILHEIPSPSDDSSRPNDSKIPQHPAAQVKTNTKGRHRRSGYEIVKQQSQQRLLLQSQSLDRFVNKQVDVIINAAFEVVKSYLILESPTFKRHVL